MKIVDASCLRLFPCVVGKNPEYPQLELEAEVSTWGGLVVPGSPLYICGYDKIDSPPTERTKNCNNFVHNSSSDDKEQSRLLQWAILEIPQGPPVFEGGYHPCKKQINV